MHSLIITAHPSSKGFTHAIASAYKATREQKGHTVEILDLYKTEFQLNFLQYEDKSELKNTSPAQQALQEKITAADELVFVFPIWWIGMPAILKNFFDVVFSSGFAYRYMK